MKAFVTGADGFIGSHLCETLRDAGHEVTGLALYNSFDSFGWLDEVDGVAKERGDIRDADQMRRLIKGHECVFHLAALISVPDSYDRPRSYIDTNVTGTLNVLMAARGAGAKIVHTSTSEVYGTAQYTPMDEKHPLHPQSPYAASKVAADALVQSFHLTYGLPCVILRPFNTFGPRQSERAVISSIIRQTLDQECQQIRMGNLEASRDFSYVRDTARAFMEIAEEKDFVLQNYSSGFGRSVKDVIKVVGEVTGINKPVIADERRLRPNASEVSCLLGEVKAPRNGFVDGIKKTVEWWQSREFRKDLSYVA